MLYLLEVVERGAAHAFRRRIWQRQLRVRLFQIDQAGFPAWYLQAFIAQLTGPAATPAINAAVAQTIADTPEKTWRAILACLTTFNRRDDQHRLTQPALLISGGHDSNAPARTMEKMAQALPNAQYINIETAGHMIQIEAPDQVNAAIRAFLTKAA